MDRAAVLAKLQSNIENAEAAYARSLRRVQSAVEDGLITEDEAATNPGLARAERTVAQRRRDLEKYLS